MAFQKINIAGTELISIGIIVSASGLKGAVKIHSLYLSIEELNNLIKKAGEFFLEDDSFPKKLTYKKSEIQSKYLVLYSNEISSIEGVETLRTAGNTGILVKTSVFFDYLKSIDSIVQYLDFDVEDERLGVLGKVDNFMMGKQNSIVVGRIIIPFVKPMIKNIDKSNKRIFTDLPEGFVE